jgi:ATP phosphoribosyltransferase
MLKIALPKGKLQEAVGNAVARGGVDLDHFRGDSRAYTASVEEARFRPLREKDIPIQVAVGNYDLGICGSDWVEELLVRQTRVGIERVAELDIDKGRLEVLAPSGPDGPSAPRVTAPSAAKPIRIVSEYPNLAEAYALRRRLPRFRVFRVWGAAEAYPPEAAELTVQLVNERASLSALEMVEVILEVRVAVIANRWSLKHKDLSRFLRVLASPEVGSWSLTS